MHYPVELYRMGTWGWTKKDSSKNWIFCSDVPKEVQELYAREGWTIIFHQKLFGDLPPLVYPLSEHQPQAKP